MKAAILRLKQAQCRRMRCKPSKNFQESRIYGNLYRTVSNKIKFLKDGIAVVQNDGRLCTHILRQHDSIIRFFRGLSETRDFPPLLSPLLSTLCCKVAKFRTRQQITCFCSSTSSFQKNSITIYRFQDTQVKLKGSLHPEWI